jgi:hypothetical protein
MNGQPLRPVLEALGLLLAPGAVAELRALGADGRISSGYFDSPERLTDAVEPMDAAGGYRGIYVTLNPVDPALLARRANRVEPRLGRGDATTADGDIVRRRWLPVDIDPFRPSGVSATADEHGAALALAEAIRDALGAEGWPAPVVADSGNGAHLLYRVDLPNDDASTALVKGVLAALDTRFSTESAKVDTANFNAARIWKCYGTVSRKGDSTTDRPHRRSAILSKPNGVEVASLDLLRALIGQSPTAPERRFENPAIAPDRDPAFDLRRWLDAHGIGIASEKPWRGGTLYALATCPFSDAHIDGAYAVQFPNGAVHAGCKHDSCGGGRQRWRELRARFEPEYAERPAVERSPSPPPRAPSEATPPPSPEADPAVVAKAREVLERGDPVRYFLDCFDKDHVGDTVLAHCLVMSIASQTILNTKGLHVYVTGESGKGKSSGMMAMLKQIPEEFRLAERMSNKALYYSDDINPGTVLLLDDNALSDDLQEVLKESTTKFTERIRMRVVNKERRIQFCTIPERCAWWLANVSALYDDQVLNRMLICWVDDSEEQDREVFRRKMADRARRPGDGGERFDLLVCREMWRRLRADGLVHVDVPFTESIRMASVRNRRNPEFLLDLVAGHALARRFQRPSERLPDGGLLVTATEEDFRYAARLFSDLHTTGGSLEAKFDRNEQLVLSLAAQNGVEQFTIADVQRWTGWQYQKVRRLFCGYMARGVQYPGLLDRTPALSLVDQTTSEFDSEGRDVKRRALVFTFNAEIYRSNRRSGEVWLADDTGNNDNNQPSDNRVERAVERVKGGLGQPESPNSDDSAEILSANDNNVNNTVSGPEDNPPDPALCMSEIVERGEGETAVAAADGGSKGYRDPDARSTSRSTCLLPVERVERGMFDPHDFLTLDGPTFEPCSACGRKPSHYRERRGGERRLCRRCYAAAVRREQRAGPPLPNAIDPAALRRVAASIGRCDVCGLDPAAWSGQGVHLCETCFQRESRRAVEAGEVIPTSLQA